MSIWGDIRKRSDGMAVRKEDEHRYVSVEDMPWEEMAAKIAEEMKKGIVHFIYKKKDKRIRGSVITGEERDAWGTKFMDIVDKIPHGGYCPPKQAGYTIYFDCQKADWRAFSDNRLIGFWTGVYTYEEFEDEVSEK